MSVTDKYKLVPYNGNNLPCDNCPIEHICDAYNQYVVYNETAGDNNLLDKCLQHVSDEETYMIPELKDEIASKYSNS